LCILISFRPSKGKQRLENLHQDRRMGLEMSKDSAVDISESNYTVAKILQSEAVKWEYPLQLNYNKTIKLMTIPKSFGSAMSREVMSN